MKRINNLLLFGVSLLVSNVALAYIGPGAGISAIGSAIAFVVVVLLLFIGFFWYPVKKLLAKIKHKNIPGESSSGEVSSDQAKGL